MNRALSFIALLFAALIWGFAFIALRWVMESTDAHLGNILRFSFMGIVALLGMTLIRGFKEFKDNYSVALKCAFSMYVCLVLQIIGLQYTTVAKSAFFTTLYAVFTPIFAMILLKRHYPKSLWFYLSFACFGVALLCDLRFDSFNIGDALTIGAAIAGASQIIIMEKAVQQFKTAWNQNFSQSLFGGLFALLHLGLLSLFGKSADLGSITHFSFKSWMGLVVLVLFSSLIAFTLQAWGQKKLKPYVAASIFLMESPFATFFAWWLLGESLTLSGIIGCLLIMMSVAGVVYLDTHIDQKEIG